MYSSTNSLDEATSSQPRRKVFFATDSVRTIVQVQNDSVKLLLTIQLILDEMLLSTKTALYAPMHSTNPKNTS